MVKVMIKILQGSAVTQTKYTSPSCKFPLGPTVYICQKLRKLAGSRQGYCKNYQAYIFGPHCIYGQWLKCKIGGSGAVCGFGDPCH